MEKAQKTTPPSSHLQIYMLHHTSVIWTQICFMRETLTSQPNVYHTEPHFTSSVILHHVLLTSSPSPTAKVSRHCERKRAEASTWPWHVSWTPGTGLAWWDCTGSCWNFPSRVYKINECFGGLGVLRQRGTGSVWTFCSWSHRDLAQFDTDGELMHDMQQHLV